MSRFRTLTALLASLALLSAACGGGDDEGGGSGDGIDVECPVDAFEDADGPVEVVVWSSYVGKTEEALEGLAAKYNASQDKVKVSVETQGNSYEQLLDNFENAINSGDLPAITINEDTNTQYMVDTGVVLPAQACIEADDDPRADPGDILPAIRNAYTVDGVQYPASANASTIVLYYNKDHFREAGLDPEDPPETLDELLATARALKKAKPDRQPMVMKLDPWFIEHWTTGAGETLVDHDNGRDAIAEAGTLENPATTQTMELLQTMKDEGLLNGVPGTPGQINHYFAVGTQSSSMLLETSTAITTINSVLEGTLDPADLGVEELDLPPIKIDVGVALNPGITEPGGGQVGGGAWYITNTTPPEVQAGAWDFVKFFNELENQVTWTLVGSYLPLRSDVAEDPRVQEDWTTTRKGMWLATAYEGLLGVNPDFPGALIGPYDDFRAALRTAMDNVVLADQSPAEALATANAEVTQKLADYADANF